MYKVGLLCLFLFSVTTAWATPWEGHIEDIENLETSIFKFQQELDVLVERKKNTREQARIEQTLSRIVEIHAELISLRKSMDTIRQHLKLEHPEKAHILDQYDSRVYGRKKRERTGTSPLSQQLDQLMIKIQLKYSSFIRQENEKEEMVAVEKEIGAKRKKKKEREADVYLRKRSKIKLIE